MKWFRLYTDILDDPKMNSLSAEDFRRMIQGFAVAAEQEKEGKIEGTIDDIAWRLRTKKTALQHTFDILISLNILKKIDNGYEFLNWKKRQFRSDNPTERWRKWKANVSANVGQTLEPTATETETETYTPIVPKNGDGTFDVFWKNYPKKIGKGAAQRAWKKIREPTKVIEQMKLVLPRQKESEQWTKDNGQYIPNPATYLNQRRWEDETI